MNLNPKMVKALNDQVHAELYSAYLYYAMSARAASMNFGGFATWLHLQAVEEYEHADKFFAYILDRDGEVALKTIEAPPAKWDSIAAIFTHVLKHEREVTARIGKLLDLAAELNDHASHSFLQWFIKEQVEEEKNATEMVERIRMAGPSSGLLLHLDREAGKRKGE